MENKLVLVAGIMVIVGVCIWVGVSGQSKQEFKAWKREFNVHYDSELEEVYREKIFFVNLALIRAHNSNPLRTYDQGLNQFSALTQEEFAHTFLHPSFLHPSFLHSSQPQKTGMMFDSEDIGEVGDINWVTNGAVTGVKNQGNCNSGYAFSAIGAIEGLGKIGKQKTLYSLSEQQVIDCSDKYGNYGCQRGYMDATYNYARDNAIYESKHYPYQGAKQSCQKQNGIMSIFAHLYVRNCTKLSSSLTKNPVSASVDASAWAFYKTGIFNNCPASPHSNHAVLVVGMVQNYWLVKNSWGTEWGENGYIKLPLGNSCGICSDGSYPVQ